MFKRRERVKALGSDEKKEVGVKTACETEFDEISVDPFSFSVAILISQLDFTFAGENQMRCVRVQSKEETKENEEEEGRER